MTKSCHDDAEAGARRKSNKLRYEAEPFYTACDMTHKHIPLGPAHSETVEKYEELLKAV